MTTNILPKNENLLLILPPLIVEERGELYIESQAHNGVRLWLENFNEVTIASPVLKEKNGIYNYINLKDLSDYDKLKVEILPLEYRPHKFLSLLSPTKKRLKDLIKSHRYLSFAIGGLWGDWAAVGGLVAHKEGRKFSVWTDRVESEVMFRTSKSYPIHKKWYYWGTALSMRYYERSVIQKSSLGLFHGNDCYSTYSRYCKNPFVVHDIHLSESDKISDDDLKKKLQFLASDRPVKILYVGQVIWMKGPEDWISVLEEINKEGIAFKATWLGGGKLLEEMRDLVKQKNLSSVIKFEGNISNRDELFNRVASQDIFLFCHKTPESPRNLIESLRYACPIVGYESDYPRDLVTKHGGGQFSPMNDVGKLVESLKSLFKNRDRLVTLTKEAAKSGNLYSDKKVFEKRSNLIKEYL